MLKTFKEIFKEHQISPSYTRTRIYAFLENRNDHPTVDNIYQELKEELPTLSKTTVYNVLNLFIEKGIVKRVNMKASEARYELYFEDHSHFKCDQCGRIYDIPKIQTLIDDHQLDDFKIYDEEVNLTGICPKCL